MVKLQVFATWGGFEHHIRDIDVSNYTPEQISEIIAKQKSLIDGCRCSIKRTPDINIENETTQLFQKLIWEQKNRKEVQK